MLIIRRTQIERHVVVCKRAKPVRRSSPIVVYIEFFFLRPGGFQATGNPPGYAPELSPSKKNDVRGFNLSKRVFLDRYAPVNGNYYIKVSRHVFHQPFSFPVASFCRIIGSVTTAQPPPNSSLLLLSWCL